MDCRHDILWSLRIKPIPLGLWAHSFAMTAAMSDLPCFPRPIHHERPHSIHGYDIEAAIPISPRPSGLASLKGSLRQPPCRVYRTGLIIVVVISLITSVCMAIATRNPGGGFTIGCFVLAAGSLAITELRDEHLQNCQCAGSKESIPRRHSTCSTFGNCSLSSGDLRNSKAFG